MKKYLFFILLLCSMMPQIIFAQDPILFQGEWKLELLTINGEDFVPPSNDEVAMIGLVFEEENEDTSPVFDTYVCNGFFGFLSFQNEEGMTPSFSFDEYSMTLIECDLPENFTFENQYFTFYLNAIEDPFEYNVEILGNDPTLFITASNEDVAIYSNPFLSIRENELPSFSIYPNPVQDQLFIQTENNLENFTITVYDILGRTLMTTSNEVLNSNSIEVHDWTSGIYFLRVEDQSGTAVTTKRFIKS